MTYQPLEHRVLKFIKAHQLTKEGDKILVALSGGLDSMVLLHLLNRLHYTVIASHCNFNIRGEEAAADEALCEETCSELNIPYFARHFETIQYAGEKKISVQMAARELRYSWFNSLLMNHGYQHIATGHHKNDQAETILLKLISGKSIESLRGIPVRNNQIIRPLLDCTKEELLLYAKEKDIKWRDDSSNEESKYQRNFLRNEIMPLLHVLNPSIDENLSLFAERMAAWNVLAEEGISHLLATVKEEKGDLTYFDFQRIMDHPAKKMLLWKLLSPYGFEGSVIDDIACGEIHSGKKFFSSANTLTFDRNGFFLEKTAPKGDPEVHLVTRNMKSIALTEGTVQMSLITAPLSAELFKEAHSAFLDSSLLTFPLIIRNWKEGDSFYPLGMNHPKKLSDYFIDKKIPVPEKHKKLVVISGGQIVWIIDERIDHRYRITENTVEVLHLNWKRYVE